MEFLLATCKAIECSRMEFRFSVWGLWKSEEDVLCGMEKEGLVITRSVIWLTKPLHIMRNTRNIVKQIDEYHG